MKFMNFMWSCLYINFLSVLILLPVFIGCDYRVMICAVNKASANLKVVFFNNFMEDDPELREGTWYKKFILNSFKQSYFQYNNIPYSMIILRRTNFHKWPISTKIKSTKLNDQT